MPLMRPCLDCGELSDGSRCPEHTKDKKRVERNAYKQRARADGRLGTTKQQGYDHAWRRLSERARQLQPFCTDCGSTTDLQADHSPEAWERKRRGLPIRLKDIDVVCRRCNVERGAARGDNVTR